MTSHTSHHEICSVVYLSFNSLFDSVVLLKAALNSRIFTKGKPYQIADLYYSSCFATENYFHIIIIIIIEVTLCIKSDRAALPNTCTLVLHVVIIIKCEKSSDRNRNQIGHIEYGRSCYLVCTPNTTNSIQPPALGCRPRLVYPLRSASAKPFYGCELCEWRIIMRTKNIIIIISITIRLIKCLNLITKVQLTEI